MNTFVAEGFLLKTWRGGPEAGKPKIPQVARGLLKHGLMQLAAYLDSQAESHAPTTICRRLAAISQMHRFNNLSFSAGHAVIRTTWKGLLRRYGRKSTRLPRLGCR